MFKEISLSYKLRLDYPVVNYMKDLVVDLPGPKNLSYLWSFGSLLGVFLLVQIVSGLILAMQYIPDADMAFYSVDLLLRDVKGGWLVRAVHCNGASFYFLFLYLHMGRGFYYYSFYFLELWFTGLVMFVLSMAMAFFGYVLPWGKMSYWGAAVMTKLFSVVPYFGKDFVFWLWGGFSVVSPTLTRFFVLHFLLPFVVLGLVVVHVLFLHSSGSNNPLGIVSDGDKIEFYLMYVAKDFFGFMVVGLIFFLFCFGSPDIFLCSENFMEAKVLSTPEHMEPDWFLLMPYAMLRSMPNKLGGVLGLMMTIVVLFVVPWVFSGSQRGNQYSVLLQILYWLWVVVMVLLCFVGASPVEDPFVILGQMLGLLYFFYFILVGMLSNY